ncbi:glycosyltransferase [Treponema primitia ZAS-2]|uniref:Glycosyltransferase n=1 Tax=Treponema primitia (strain ATCC BAA-887 / DSM 12427 / ZAS-2) TaxID=545694 RepID=F5YGP2_TREPZ|nr:glycosyltransferase family 2 protein [Treponema primitia]AEF84306.1 glycosyltransferase [Treponema primitia ZAS-2]
MVDKLVSIITPIYNGSKYIGETIESVRNQRYTNWEMIIIDDGSTDKSIEVINSVISSDPRFLLLQQANMGSASARNNGIRHANGQYIALLDADDLWEPNFLESQIDFLKKNNAVLVYASCGRINEYSKEFLNPVMARPFITYKKMLSTNYIQCLTGLYDTTKYGKVYLREELKSIRDDYAYWLDILKFSGIAYGNPEVLAKYRLIGSSTTGVKTKLIKKQFSFYHQYLGLSYVRSIFNTLYWGLQGIVKLNW